MDTSKHKTLKELISSSARRLPRNRAEFLWVWEPETPSLEREQTDIMTGSH